MTFDDQVQYRLDIEPPTPRLEAAQNISIRVSALRLLLAFKRATLAEAGQSQEQGQEQPPFRAS